jgi:hypothetical protein
MSATDSSEMNEDLALQPQNHNSKTMFILFVGSPYLPDLEAASQVVEHLLLGYVLLHKCRATRTSGT